MDEKFPLALPNGSTLAGQYIIEKTLGQGGFGITYKAVDHKTGEKVAIKEFFPDSMATRQGTTVIPFTGERGESYAFGKEWFLKEAETLAQFIGVEGIVRIHTYFEENQTAYFVMDYVEGVSFDEYIKNSGGKVTYEVAESVLIRVIEALAVVHSKGIVHRDVTPDNIYITNDGQVKLLDFGAARYSLGDKSRSLDVVLKHGFAPKEQYTRHGRQGPFTDIYTVGASFYFAITGKRPPDSIDRIEEDDLVPPSSLGIPIPREKEDAILKAMSVQPGDRFKTMDEFKNALLGYVQTSNDGYYNQYAQPNNQQYNGQYNNQMYATEQTYQQQGDMYQTYTYNNQPDKKSKKWLIPVICAVCVIAIVAVVYINSNKKSGKKTSSKNVADNEIDIVALDDSVEFKDDESLVVKGTFDTDVVNNISNTGLEYFNSNTIIMATANGVLYSNDGGNTNKTIDSSPYCYDVNYINDEQIVYMKYVDKENRPFAAYTDGRKSNEIQYLKDIHNISTLIANEYGTFVIYDDVLNYFTWSGKVPKYYYNCTNNTVTIMNDTVYWIDNDGVSLEYVSLSSYGSATSQLLYKLDFPVSYMVGEGKYLYVIGNDSETNNVRIGRYNTETNEFILCKKALGSTGSNYPSGFNVKNGKLYYSLTDWSSYSEIWCLTTDESGWDADDFSSLWKSDNSGKIVSGLCMVDNEGIYFNVNEGATIYVGMLELSNNNVSFYD